MIEKDSGSAGFTLIEALVAFAILSLAFAIVLPLLLDSGQSANEASNSRLALLVAQSRFAEVGRERPLVPGQWSGRENNAFAWRIDIRENPLLQKDNPSRLTAYDVAVTVLPPGARPGQALRLTTTRIGLAP